MRISESVLESEEVGVAVSRSLDFSETDRVSETLDMSVSCISAGAVFPAPFESLNDAVESNLTFPVLSDMSGSADVLNSGWTVLAHLALGL